MEDSQNVLNLKMYLIDCELNYILTASVNHVTKDSTSAGTFKVTNTKLNGAAVTLLIQDKLNLLKQLKLVF